MAAERERKVTKHLENIKYRRIYEDEQYIEVKAKFSPREEKIDLKDGQRIAVQHWGDPTASIRILALHGWLDNSNTWNTFIPLLLQETNQKMHIVAMDFAGHGYSSHKPNSALYSINTHALDSFAVADALSWETFYLMGHSLGGVVTTLMACLMPERVLKAMSVDTFGPFVPPGDHASYLKKGFTTYPNLLRRQPRTYPSFESLFNRYRENNPRLYESSARRILDRAVEKISVAGMEGEEDGEGFCFRHDPRLVGSSIDVFHEEEVKSLFKHASSPILFVMAADNRFFEFTCATIRRRVGYFRNTKADVVICDGDHHVHLDNPERVLKSAIEFFFGPQKAKL